MIKDFIWDFFGRFWNIAFSFIISIILTRLLSPIEYGIMGMAMVIISLAGVFIDLGFYRAIVQQREISKVQLSTIFFINLALAFLLTGICYFLAAPLAQFYKQPLVKPVFETLSIIFILNALNLVPSALIYRQMRFKQITIYSLIAAIVSGTTGIILAYSGYGVWSLVVQTLVNPLVLFCCYFFYTKWKPLFIFDFSAVKPLWNYGSRLFASGLLDQGFTRADSFIIGKLFPVSFLGYYTRAQSLDGILRQLSMNSIMSVLYPHIAKHQHDRKYITELFIKYLHLISFISFALCGFLFLTASDIFIILFTAKWSFSAELFKIMSIGAFVYPISALMVDIITGVGNSKEYLRLEILKKTILIPVYVFGFWMGLKGFVFLLVLAGYLSLILNIIFVSKEVSIKASQQFIIISKYFICTVLACVSAFYISHFFHFKYTILNILLNSLSFIFVYLTLSHLGQLYGKKIICLKLSTLRLSF